jgi:PKD domain/Bacterial Ig domain
MKPVTRAWCTALLFAFSLVFLVAGASGVLTITVGPNVNVTKAGGSQAEGTIAINPTNSMQLFEASNSGATARRSTDGGATWLTSVAGIGSSCCDNVASWDSFGNLFLVNINGALNAVVLYLSTDGGANFSSLATIDTGTIDQPSVKAGAGAVWVTWNDSGTIKARGAAVTGLGSGNIGAFNAEQSAPSSGAVGGQFGDIAIGPSGQVVVTYQSNTQIFVNTDADGLGAGGFGAQVTVSSTNVAKFDSVTPQDARTIDAEANLAYDRSGGSHNGRLYLAYTDETPDESNDTDIFVRRSDTNGATWSAAVQVNDDATTRAQILPNISLDQTTGNVAVTWHDARNDPGNNNTQFFGSASTDGGVTFLPNFQISQGTSNEDVAGSSTDYGDYTSSDFNGGLLFPIWADNSNSTGDNPAGANSTFDMYTARVRIAENQPPVVTVGNASGNEGAAIPISGTATDPDGDPLTSTWTYAPGVGVDAGATCTIASPGSLSTTITCTDDGTYTLTLTVSDGINPAVVKTATLTVANVAPSVSITAPTSGQLFQLADPVNVTAPFSDAGTNDTHTCSIDFGDGTVIAGTVVEVAGAGTCTGTHTYSAGGMKTIKVTVTDDDGGAASASVTIDINSPPDCSTVTPSETSLWPPNHKLREISLSGATDPDGDVVTLTATGVTQDEPVNGLGDGDTAPDAALGPASNVVQLRAERSGTGDGRVYRIAFSGSDGRGGTCTGTVFVSVPHNPGSPAVDSGLVFDSLVS